MWAEKSAWSCVWTSDLNCAGCSVCVNVFKNPNAKKHYKVYSKWWSSWEWHQKW